MTYGHTMALLPRCTEHPERQALVIDEHSDRLLCADCARPMYTSAAHKGALSTIA